MVTARNFIVKALLFCPWSISVIIYIQVEFDILDFSYQAI